MSSMRKMPQHIFDIAQKLVPVPESFGRSSGGIYLPCSNLPSWTSPTIEPQPTPIPPEPPYEVNMVEALVGWKAWGFSEERQVLVTRGHHWPTNAPVVSAHTEFVGGKEVIRCKEIPNENCSCGIYAADSREGAQEYYDDGDIIGRVAGWGRYIRGDSGWRAQFAYPQCFYLHSGQGNLIEWLRLYHVPIYIEQPQLIYNPEEDGYEYRGEEADGYCRTFEESTSAEEDDPDY